jgi:hypothetical protein
MSIDNNRSNIINAPVQDQIECQPKEGRNDAKSSVNNGRRYSYVSASDSLVKLYRTTADGLTRAIHPLIETLSARDSWIKLYRTTADGLNKVVHPLIETIAKPVTSDSLVKLYRTATDGLARVVHPLIETISAKPVIYENHLDPKDHALNLERFAHINPLEMMSSICTYEIYKTIPTLNFIPLGYENENELENRLGNDVIAGMIGTTSLTVLLSSFAKLANCVAESTEDVSIAVDFCYAQVAERLSSSQLILPAGVLLAALYLHSNGWLGRWLHDPFKGQRTERIADLYRNIANELYTQVERARATDDQKELAKLGNLSAKIQKNIPAIRKALSELVQIDADDAKRVVNYLEWACQKRMEGKGIKLDPSGRSDDVKLSKGMLALNIFQAVRPSVFTMAIITYIIGKKLWTR